MNPAHHLVEDDELPWIQNIHFDGSEYRYPTLAAENHEWFGVSNVLVLHLDTQERAAPCHLTRHGFTSQSYPHSIPTPPNSKGAEIRVANLGHHDVARASQFLIVGRQS